jgi:hypothetical protein
MDADESSNANQDDGWLVPVDRSKAVQNHLELVDPTNAHADYITVIRDCGK